MSRPEAAQSEHDVDLLLNMSDEDFDALVSDEVRLHAETWVEQALRHDDLLDRWDESLHRLYTGITSQLAGRKGEKNPETREWRHRALRVQGAAQARKREVRALIRERNVECAAEQHGGERPYAKKKRKEIRRAASERAVSRLIEAHRSEFMAILAEEELAEVTTPARYGERAPESAPARVMSQEPGDTP